MFFFSSKFCFFFSYVFVSETFVFILLHEQVLTTRKYVCVCVCVCTKLKIFLLNAFDEKKKKTNEWEQSYWKSYKNLPSKGIVWFKKNVLWLENLCWLAKKKHKPQTDRFFSYLSVNTLYWKCRSCQNITKTQRVSSAINAQRLEK